MHTHCSQVDFTCEALQTKEAWISGQCLTRAHWLLSDRGRSLLEFSPSLPLLPWVFRGGIKRLLWGTHLSPVMPQLQTTTICCCCVG